MQSCSASDSSKDRVDTPRAKQQSMCESVCSLINIKHVFAPRVVYFFRFCVLQEKNIFAESNFTLDFIVFEINTTSWWFLIEVSSYEDCFFMGVMCSRLYSVSYVGVVYA